jgi:hypothetical protein
MTIVTEEGRGPAEDTPGPAPHFHWLESLPSVI